jgi:hypothetical protein
MIFPFLKTVFTPKPELFFPSFRFLAHKTTLNKQTHKVDLIITIAYLMGGPPNSSQGVDSSS